MLKYVKVIKQRVAFWHIPQFEKMGYRAVFFMRLGGVSKKPYRSLNLGFNTEDDPRKILINRKRAIGAAKLGPLQPVCGQQVHGNQLCFVGKKDDGRGWKLVKDAIPNTDALITQISGLPITVTIADCIPILVVSEGNKGIAAIHVGWRGLQKRIIEKTLKTMMGKFKIKGKELWVAMGQSIGTEKFEIKDNIVEKLSEIDISCLIYDKNGKKYYDLKKAAINQLLKLGIDRKKVININECTYSNAKDYFSFRRDQKTGRMLGIVQINPTL